MLVEVDDIFRERGAASDGGWRVDRRGSFSFPSFVGVSCETVRGKYEEQLLVGESGCG